MQISTDYTQNQRHIQSVTNFEEGSLSDIQNRWVVVEPLQRRTM